jgi:hypothetical protein
MQKFLARGRHPYECFIGIREEWAMKKLIFVWIYAVSATMTGAAFAATCGYDIHVSSTDVMELGKDHRLILYNSKATLVMDDHNDPRHLAKGECKGMVTIEGGKTYASGACWWKDADGDQVTSIWEAVLNPGESPKRTWKWSASNTGKYAGKTRSGTYTPLPGGGSRWCDD